MDKLRLLKKLNDDGLLASLSGDELRLFLLMVANSAGNGKGKILLSRIRLIFGKDFSSERLQDICGRLERKLLVRTNLSPGRDPRRHGLAVTYRILVPDRSAPAGSEPGNR